MLSLSWAHAAAQGRATARTATAEPLLTTVEQYVAAFRANYRPATHERQALAAAEAALTAAATELQPRLTFAESLEWDAYTALSLELEAGIELPLLSSTAEPRHGLADLDLEARRLALRSARNDAFAALLIDLANLATVTWAQALAGDARAHFDQLGFDWLADRDRGYAGYVPPGERAAFDSYQRLAEAEAWLAEQSRFMFGRLARSLDAREDRLRAPSMTELERWLATGRVALPDVASCQEASLLAAAARHRHVRNVASDTLQALPEYSLALTADVDLDLGPWSTGAAPPGDHGGFAGAGLAGAIGLEGSYLVPAGWPLGGNVNLAFGSDGASQRLNLAWPPLPQPQVVAVDRDRELALELATLEAELRSLRNAAAQATTDVELSEQQLRWALIDAAPDLDQDEVSKVVSEALTIPSLALPGLALQSLALPSRPLPTAVMPGPAADHVLASVGLAELRLEHAFARVAELSARVHYLGACAQL